MKLPRIHSCDREQFIMRYADGQRVLHVGCADMPFTAKKLRQGRLLHQRLLPVAAELTGVDVSGDGVALMRQAGIGDLHVLNAETKLSEVFGAQRFDVIVAGEVLEHVLNAGILLESLKSVCHPQSCIVLTTVNFAPIKRTYRLLYLDESVHPDHVCYYSLATLTCLLKQCGYKPLEWAAHWWDVGRVSRIVNKILRKAPFFVQYYADGLCVACTLSQERL